VNKGLCGFSTEKGLVHKERKKEPKKERKDYGYYFLI